MRVFVALLCLAGGEYAPKSWVTVRRCADFTLACGVWRPKKHPHKGPRSRVDKGEPSQRTRRNSRTRRGPRGRSEIAGAAPSTIVGGQKHARRGSSRPRGPPSRPRRQKQRRFKSVRTARARRRTSGALLDASFGGPSRVFPASESPSELPLSPPELARTVTARAARSFEPARDGAVGHAGAGARAGRSRRRYTAAACRAPAAPSLPAGRRPPGAQIGDAPPARARARPAEPSRAVGEAAARRRRAAARGGPSARTAGSRPPARVTCPGCQRPQGPRPDKPRPGQARAAGARRARPNWDALPDGHAAGDAPATSVPRPRRAAAACGRRTATAKAIARAIHAIDATCAGPSHRKTHARSRYLTPRARARGAPTRSSCRTARASRCSRPTP